VLVEFVYFVEQDRLLDGDIGRVDARVLHGQCE